MELYSVKKSDGRVGYQWTCPKGFTHYNFWTEESAWQDAELARMRAENERPREALMKVSAIQNEMYGGDWDEIDCARTIAKEALK